MGRNENNQARGEWLLLLTKGQIPARWLGHLKLPHDTNLGRREAAIKPVIEAKEVLKVAAEEAMLLGVVVLGAAE